MNHATSLKRKLDAIRKSASQDAPEVALQKVDSLLTQAPYLPALHVMRGELIQLQNDNGPTLDDAEAAFSEACALDGRYPDALIELGHFQFSVSDDCRSAEKTFGRAVQVSAEMLNQALLGRAASLSELGKKAEAFQCLALAGVLEQAGITLGKNNVEPLLDRFEEMLASH